MKSNNFPSLNEVSMLDNVSSSKNQIDNSSSLGNRNNGTTGNKDGNSRFGVSNSRSNGRQQYPSKDNQMYNNNQRNNERSNTGNKVGISNSNRSTGNNNTYSDNNKHKHKSSAVSPDAGTGSTSSNNGYNRQNNMGMGGGMGGMGGYGMGGMGMGGMGMMGMMGMGNPLFYNIQQFQYSLMMMGQMVQMIGMSASALGSSVIKAIKLMKKCLIIISHSKYAKWVQTKSKQSKVFQTLLVVLSMFITSNIMNIIKYYVVMNSNCLQSSSAGSGGVLSSCLTDNIKQSLDAIGLGWIYSLLFSGMGMGMGGMGMGGYGGGMGMGGYGSGGGGMNNNYNRNNSSYNTNTTNSIHELPIVSNTNTNTNTNNI